MVQRRGHLRKGAIHTYLYCIHTHTCIHTYIHTYIHTGDTPRVEVAAESGQEKGQEECGGVARDLQPTLDRPFRLRLAIHTYIHTFSSITNTYIHYSGYFLKQYADLQEQQPT